MFRALWKVIADRVGRSDGHRRRHRPLRLGIETLEARRLLSIVWSHRGSDDFETYYGANAELARSIVDRAFVH